VSAGADTAAAWGVSATLVGAGHLRVGLIGAGGSPLAPGLREIAQLQFHVVADGALDIEPVDLRAGGYTWTAVDGSLAVTKSDALTRPVAEAEQAAAAPALPATGGPRERLFGALESELSPLAEVLDDLTPDIAGEWNRGPA
jgi:hypothetical protein